MELDASLWAFIGLVVFLGLITYLGVPKKVIATLDDKSKQIADELEEAKRLREEAQALLAEYERKRKAAEDEAAEIVEAAKSEADRMTEEAQQSLDDLITRRTKAVEEKIAQAEAQALADVRARSADIAVEAARIVLADKMSEKGDALIDAAIKDVSAKLN
ncbi:F0F1 ATP synthase subunit B family protein [Maritalea mediterranea]|uniref:ATP synthase subunit b n=1 Tax=Maritalea mediterranea TaxID=2909667 RepID=A0ABS9E4U0_9HYPH|nr:ATP F0F1 synthase subunit B [Maritalea mediterranea]MCF4097817.1 ATP F0F1 synthase subunit B [Maritalea mediterranea]